MSRERLEPAPISPLERQLLVAGASSSQAKPNIQPIGTSPLLSQLKQFLPKMQQANAELQQKLQECDPAELDIEHVPEQEGEGGPVIQMDLACGLLELHDDAAVAAAQRAIAAGGEIAIETYDGGSGTDSESESDGESDSDGGSGSDEDMTDAAAAGDVGGDAGEAAAAVVKGPGGASTQQGAAAAGTRQRGGSAAAAAAGVTNAEAAASETQPSHQQQEQQQQQPVKHRRKLKPKRPMIVEL